MCWRQRCRWLPPWGRYQEREKEAQPLQKGGVVVIPAGVEHWHGATARDRMEHVVITDYEGEECVMWLGPVTDREYAVLPGTHSATFEGAGNGE